MLADRFGQKTLRICLVSALNEANRTLPGSGYASITPTWLLRVIDGVLRPGGRFLPRHEAVQIGHVMARCKAGKRAGEPRLGTTPFSLAVSMSQANAAQCWATFVRAGGERGLAVERERKDSSFDCVAVVIDTPNIEEVGQPAGERRADRLAKGAFAARPRSARPRSRKAVRCAPRRHQLQVTRHP